MDLATTRIGPHPASGRPKVGVSACLLGLRVRYDGDHRRHAYLAEVAAREWDLLPVCPEVECGMGVPREPIRLVGDPSAPRLVGRESGEDHTARMEAWAARRLAGMAAEPLCGFVFKSKSPSSGLRDVKVLLEDGSVRRTGVGLFARLFTARFPFLPVIDELGLGDPGQRQRFLDQVCTVHRLRHLGTPAALLSFLRARRAAVRRAAPHLAPRLEGLLAASPSLPWDALWQRCAELVLAAGRLADDAWLLDP